MILGRHQLGGQGSSAGSQSGGETGGQREEGGAEGEAERQRGAAGRGGRAPRSGGGDGGAAPQLDDQLLAVVAGAPVARLLQGSGRLGQQHRPLARGGEEGEGKVAAGQQDGGGPLALAGPGVRLSCGNERCMWAPRGACWAAGAAARAPRGRVRSATAPAGEAGSRALPGSRGGDKNVAGITRLVFRGGGEMRPLGLALGPVLPPWLLPWGVPGPTPTRPHSAPSWATRQVEPWAPLLPTALPGWAGPARGLRAGALGDSPGLAFWVPRRRRLCSSSWWVRVGLAPAIRRTVASCRNTWGGAAETRSSPGAPPVCPSPHRCLSLQQLICHLTPALPSTAPRPAHHRCSPTPDTEWERGTGSGL